jgi:uncharacterized protein (TIGR02646 family)
VRFIDRRRTPAPDVLNRPGRNGTTARQRIDEHFSSTPLEPFDFDTYHHDDVKRALEELFGSKCAYCEGKYAAFHAMIVEHFRPKGEVREEDGTTTRPGYYWLAVEWENLFASCIDCNSWRYYLDSRGEPVRLGKANRFPLADPSNRARAPGDEVREEPLILNPTACDPTEHLEFTAAGIVVARQQASGELSVHGSVSIDVFALQRPLLVERRRAHAIRVQAAIAAVRIAARNRDKYPEDPDFPGYLEGAKRDLLTFLDSEAEFSSLARDLAEESGML